MQYYNNHGDIITHKDIYTGKVLAKWPPTWNK